MKPNKTYHVVLTYTATYEWDGDAPTKALALVEAGKTLHEEGVMDQITVYGLIVSVKKVAVEVDA